MATTACTSSSSKLRKRPTKPLVGRADLQSRAHSPWMTARTSAPLEMLVALALGTRAATGTGAATGTPVDTLLVVTFRAATTGDITLGGTPDTTLVDTTQVETTPVATTPETTVMVAM